jgi:beta-N-acetylhexosaminidase
MRDLRLVLAGALTFVLLGLGVTADATALAVSPPAAELCAAVPHIGCWEGLDATGATEPTSEPPAEPAVEEVAEPSLEQLIGQKLMVTMSGRKVSPALAGRIRRGEIGGVILLRRNVTTRSALRKLTRKLQRTAANAGQPPLLIAIDQEGGSVRRVPWAPPTISIPEIGRIGSTSVARAQGARTGSALRSLGINVDLAPVADVPRSRASFMLQQGRTFSFDANQTTRLANAFASGLGSRGVLATMKHFPGIGLAIRNTDRFVDTIRAPKTALRPDLRPYRRAIANGVPIIMLSNATYTAFDRRNAAGWSRAIADRLLRQKLGFEGVSITDSLNGTANARGVTVRNLALRSARAGTDMILVTGSERSTSRLYGWLLRKAQAGKIPLPRLRTSHDRILALKERL